MTGHLRLDSVIAESLRHSETQRQSEKRVRERRWVQRVLRAATFHYRKCDSAAVRTNPFKRGRMRKGGKSSLDMCLR